MTIRDLIHRENETSLGLSMNDRLEEMKEQKEYLKEHPYSDSAKEWYLQEKNMLLGMICASLCLKVITDIEFLEICEDIRKNY